MSQRPEATYVTPSTKNISTASQPPPKTSRLERSDAKWGSHKTEIYQMYVDQNMTLKETMNAMESQHSFKARQALPRESPRKWKMKIKEWNFEKNLPANEMAFIAAKAEKRRADEGKETIFFRGDMWIGPERIENFKKRKLTATDMADLPVIIDTPTNVTYHTPLAEVEQSGGQYQLGDEVSSNSHSLTREGQDREGQDQGQDQSQDQAHGHDQNQGGDRDQAEMGNFCKQLQDTMTECVYATPKSQPYTISQGVDDSDTSGTTFRNVTASSSNRLRSTPDIPEAPKTHTVTMAPETASTPAIEANSKEKHPSVILFDPKCILQLLQSHSVTHIAFDVFRGILERLPTLSTSHVDHDTNKRKEKEVCSEYDEDFFQANVSTIKDGVSAAVELAGNSPFELIGACQIPLSFTTEDGSQLQSKLLSLLQNIKISQEKYARGLLAASAIELAYVALAFVQLCRHSSYRIALQPAVTDLVRYIVKHWQHDILLNQHLLSPFDPKDTMTCLESLADELYHEQFLRSAEIIWRHLITQIRPEDEYEMCRHQSSLFRVLYTTNRNQSFNEELARLSIVSLAYSFRDHFLLPRTVGMGTQFGLAAHKFRKIWAMYQFRQDEKEEGETPKQKTKLLSQNILQTISCDDLIAIFAMFFSLGNLCSLLCWYDTANGVFKLSLNHVYFTLESFNWSLSRERARGYAWHALNLQRQQDFPKSFKVLCDGYKELERGKGFSDNAEAEHREILKLLRSMLDTVPQSLTAETSELRELDKLVETLPFTSLWGTRQDFFTPNTHSLTSFVGGTSSVSGTISTGRYGVTYSESVVSGVSLNYSALFP